MRAIPGMVVVSPCDGPEMRAAVKALLDYEGPAYMRLGRLAVESVTDEIEGYKFELGKATTVRDYGTDLTMIVSGILLKKALDAAEILKADGINARVINMHTIKPIDKELVLKAAAETGAIVTCEEHYIMGGLGSAVCEVVCKNCPVPVKIIGTDRYGKSGKPAELFEEYGLTAKNIAENAKACMKLKNR